MTRSAKPPNARERKSTVLVLAVLGILVLSTSPVVAAPAPESLVGATSQGQDAATGSVLAEERNVALAHRLLSVDPTTYPDELTLVVALAKEGTLAQAASLGWAAVPAPSPRHDPPSAALLALAQREHVQLTEDELGSIASLDALPPQQAGALARFVEAFLAFDGASASRRIGGD